MDCRVKTGNDERERTKKIRRRNADRRNEYSAVANGHGRACKRQAHIYRRSTAVLVPRSLSSQGTQHQAFSSWDLAAISSMKRGRNIFMRLEFFSPVQSRGGHLTSGREEASLQIRRYPRGLCHSA